MPYAIKLLGEAGGKRFPAPAYVVEYDPEAEAGLGFLRMTYYPEEAKTYDSQDAAIAEYRKVPKARPLREDGNPNRPLTAFDVEIVELGEGEA